MIRNRDSMTVGDKVAAAAKSAMRSVVETARRTGTKIIVMRDGKIVHLSPDQLSELGCESNPRTDSN
jgi:argonaute-like protein implicated in RNA metabolism and viral defense